MGKSIRTTEDKPKFLEHIVLLSNEYYSIAFVFAYPLQNLQDAVESLMAFLVAKISIVVFSALFPFPLFAVVYSRTIMPYIVDCHTYDANTFIIFCILFYNTNNHQDLVCRPPHNCVRQGVTDCETIALNA